MEDADATKIQSVSTNDIPTVENLNETKFFLYDIDNSRWSSFGRKRRPTNRLHYCYNNDICSVCNINPPLKRIVVRRAIGLLKETATRRDTLKTC